MNHPSRADSPGRSPGPAQIRALRRAAGISQTGLADRLGVSLRTVQGWEGGESSMQPGTWMYAQAACSGDAEAWIDRAHPGLSQELQRLLAEAYRAGRMSR